MTTRLATDGPIDLLHLGTEHVVGCYLLETVQGLALHDCGPSSTLPTLEAALDDRGIGVADIDHLVLSHIHLDHAGAAGQLVARNPKLRVHVSPIGAPHLVRPEALEGSARRVFGDAFDSLWGPLAPVPEGNIELATDTTLGMRVVASPGHATHHLCYLLEDGTLLCGDAAGVRIMPHRHIYPVAPPPGVDVGDWHRTIDTLSSLKPFRLALIHFGIVDDADDHFARLANELDRWAGLVERGADEAQFASAVHEGLQRDGDAAAQHLYDQTGPPGMSFSGLRRYLAKRNVMR